MLTITFTTIYIIGFILFFTNTLITVEKRKKGQSVGAFIASLFWPLIMIYVWLRPS